MLLFVLAFIVISACKTHTHSLGCNCSHCSLFSGISSICAQPFLLAAAFLYIIAFRSAPRRRLCLKCHCKAIKSENNYLEGGCCWMKEQRTNNTLLFDNLIPRDLALRQPRANLFVYASSLTLAWTVVSAFAIYYFGQMSLGT